MGECMGGKIRKEGTQEEGRKEKREERRAFCEEGIEWEKNRRRRKGRRGRRDGESLGGKTRKKGTQEGRREKSESVL